MMVLGIGQVVETVASVAIFLVLIYLLFLTGW